MDSPTTNARSNSSGTPQPHPSSSSNTSSNGIKTKKHKQVSIFIGESPQENVILHPHATHTHTHSDANPPPSILKKTEHTTTASTTALRTSATEQDTTSEREADIVVSSLPPLPIPVPPPAVIPLPHLIHDEADDSDLDLELLDTDITLISDDGEEGDDSSPAHSLSFDSDSVAFPVSHPVPVVEVPRATRWLSWLSLAIAVLSMSAVGPMFLYLERDLSVPAILAACWRCQAMLIFLLIPTLIEWYNIDEQERKWSHLHVPPSPKDHEVVHHQLNSLVSASNTHQTGQPTSMNQQPSEFSISPHHRKGVASMVEMNDNDKISTFLDDQYNQTVVSELEEEIREEAEEEEREWEENGQAHGHSDIAHAVRTGIRMPEEEEEEEFQPSYLHHQHKHTSSDKQTHSLSSPLSLSPSSASSFSIPSRSAALSRGKKKARLRISTVVPDGRMAAVHVSWYVLALSLSWGGSLALWVAALCYTSTARASLFSSTYPLMLLAWMKWKGVQVSMCETIGVVITLFGIVISEIMGYFTHTNRLTEDIHSNTTNATAVIADTSSVLSVSAGAASLTPLSSLSSSTQSQCGLFISPWVQLLGDLMCILASVLIAINIAWAGRARRVLRLFSYTFSTTLIVTVFLGLLSWLTEGTTIDFSQHGMFGWLVDGQLLWMISLFGFVVGMIGVLGFNFSVKYTNPVLFATAQLLDPGLTALMSWLAGLEELPSTATFLGVAIVSLGIMCVIIGESHRNKQAEATHSYAAVDSEPHG